MILDIDLFYNKAPIAFPTTMFSSEGFFEISTFVRVANACNKRWDQEELNAVARMIYFVGVKKYKIPMGEWCLLLRCESDFSKKCRSSAGAISLFQVMPRTARIVCKELGIKYSYERLRNDVFYNAGIGMRFYADLKKNYPDKYKTITVYNYGHFHKRYLAAYKPYIVRKQKELMGIIEDIYFWR